MVLESLSCLGTNHLTRQKKNAYIYYNKPVILKIVTMDMKITQVFILSLPNFYDTSDEKKKALVCNK